MLYGFALADPDRQLFDWLDDTGKIVNSYSRGELWNRGRVLAERLEKEGIKRGDFVMIVYPYIPPIRPLPGISALNLSPEPEPLDCMNPEPSTLHSDP